MGKIHVVAQEEVPKSEDQQRVELANVYPTLALPNDLERLRVSVESQLESLPRVDKDGGAIFLSSSPFDVYKVFHFLLNNPSELSDKLKSFKTILEPGCALGLISFIAAQFFPRARVEGNDINPVLVGVAYKVRQILTALGYNVSLTRFFEANFLGSVTKTYDAIIGSFPLGDNEKQLINSLRENLNTGGILFQMYRPIPFDSTEKAAAYGFRQISLDSSIQLNCAMFEKS